MRRILFITLVSLIAASTVVSQPGVIGVYGDPNAGSCDIYDYPRADVLVYVIHTYSPGSTGSRFKLRWTGGASMSYLGEVVSAPYSAKGTAFNGISIEYGTCAVSPNILITLHFS